MDTEQNFWLYALLLTLLIVASIETSCTFQNAQDNDAIVRMVKEGASPLAARCAVRPTNEPACVLSEEWRKKQ